MTRDGGEARSSAPGESAPGVVADESLILGDAARCDAGVLLGYLPDRPVPSLILRIGQACRIRSGSCIYAGSTIGRNFQTGHHVTVREESQIGDDVCVWSNTVIDYGCQIGHRVKIHCNVYVPQRTRIEDDVFIAPGCSFANDRYPGCPESLARMEGPVLERGARVGAHATILPGVVIGARALVGAGSVVVRDVPPGSVVVGNPARTVKSTRDLGCCSGAPDCLFTRAEDERS